jgi:hypothetical protein
MTVQPSHYCLISVAASLLAPGRSKLWLSMTMQCDRARGPAVAGSSLRASGLGQDRHRHGGAERSLTGAIVGESKASVTLCDAGSTGRHKKGGYEGMARSVAFSSVGLATAVGKGVAW